MKIIKNLTTLLALLISVNAYAESIKPPKGIRFYDIGLAENFKLKDIDGESFELKNSRGKWVFLHFWASWCGPCRKEMPSIQRLTNSLNKDSITFVFVNTAENEDTIFTFMSAIDMEINSLMDTDGEVTEMWKPRGLPTTFLIDPQGYVRYQAIGGRDWDKGMYRKFIKKLLESPLHKTPTRRTPD